MAPSTAETAQAVVQTFSSAYEPYVMARIDVVAPDTPGMSDAVAEGRSWLVESLQALVEEPFERQSRSPLEIFQEAMRFPTETLSEAGVAPIERDEVARTALPGDLFGLAPASSQDLGEEAWQAHLAWGVAKAAALTRPVVGLLSSDLMDRSRVESAVIEAGYRLEVWRDATALDATPKRRLLVAFVDLGHPDADEAIASLSGDGGRVVAFGPHVDDFALVRARTLGASDALARSAFFRRIGDLIPPVL